MTGLSAPFIPILMPTSLLHASLPIHRFFVAFSLYPSFFQDSRHFFFCTPRCQGHCPPCSTAPARPPRPSILFFFFLSKFSVHCPPDSHPSTWVQFKKPFNSCHSTGLAISPAAKAQTGTLLQQATLNVRLVPPIPNRLKVKDSISQRLAQLKAG